jgi:hypothetical protein
MQASIDRNHSPGELCLLFRPKETTQNCDFEQEMMIDDDGDESSDSSYEESHRPVNGKN